MVFKRVLVAVWSCLCVSGVVSAAAQSEGARVAAVELAGNPTTGYSWTYTMENPGIIAELSHEYRSNQAAEAAPQRLGAGGIFSFVFEGLREGQTELRFVYARSWEAPEKAAARAVFTVSVDKLRRLTIKQHREE
ncbi:protease inhibitor I42 family protein [Breznakiellaceae bacterium SP9]